MWVLNNISRKTQASIDSVFLEATHMLDCVPACLADVSSLAPEEASEPTPALVDSGADGDAAKRIRNLQKKFRQVQQLKEKAATGAPLELEQEAKLAGEAALLDELRSLGV